MEVIPDKSPECAEHQQAKDKLLSMITFVTGGMCAALAWNCIVNGFVSLQQVIYPGNVFSDLLGGVEFSMALIVSLIMYSVDDPKPKYEIIAATVNIVVIFAIPLTIQLFPGNENLGIARVILVGLSALVGIESGISNVVVYSLAGLVSPQAVGLVSMGNGLAGVWTFITFLILSECFFGRTVIDQIRLLWFFYGFTSFIFVLHIICLYKLNQRPWFRNRIDLQKTYQSSLIQLEKGPLLVPSPEEDGTRWHLFKSVLFKSKWFALAALFNIAITLMVFPLVGPYQWKQPYTIISILNGVFQFTNMAFRIMPIFIPKLIINQKYILLLVLARAVIFFPSFMLPAKLAQHPFFHSPYFLIPLMFCFSAVHGWCTTLTALFTIGSVESKKEKSIASKIVAICFLGACILGLFSSKLFLL